MSTVPSIAPRRKSAVTEVPPLAELDELMARAMNAFTDAGAVRTARRAGCDSFLPSQIDEEIAYLSWVDVSRETLSFVLSGISKGERPASRAEIGQHLALMLGAFPAAANALDPQCYGRLLVEEVAAHKPSRLSLDSTCRRIRRTHKWPPAIAEVLEILKEEERKWRDWKAAAEDLPDLYADTIEFLKKRRDELDRQEAAFAHPLGPSAKKAAA